MAAVAAREIRASAVKYQRIAWVSARTAAIRCLPWGSSSTFRAWLRQCPRPKSKSLGQQEYPLCFEMAFSGQPRPSGAWRGSRSLVACRGGAIVQRRERPVQPTCGPFPYYHESGRQIRRSVAFSGQRGKDRLPGVQLERFLPAPERYIFVPGHRCEEWLRKASSPFAGFKAFCRSTGSMAWPVSMKPARRRSTWKPSTGGSHGGTLGSG